MAKIFEVSLGAHRYWYDAEREGLFDQATDQRVDATEKGWLLLVRFMSSPPDTLIRFGDLVECAWDGDRNTPPNTVDQAVKRFNHRLGVRLIEKVRGRGYRLAAQVREVDETEIEKARAASKPLPVETDAKPVPSDHDARAYKWYRERHPSLRQTARKYYEDCADAAFRIVTQESWIPPTPIPLEKIDREMQFHWQGNEPDATPAELPILRGERYSDFISRVAPIVRHDDRHCYRLLGVSVGNRSFALQFGSSCYARFVDSCDALGFELAEWLLRNGGGAPNAQPAKTGVDLPARGRPESIFDLRNRSACPGVSAVLIIKNNQKGDVFFLQRREGRALFDSPGGLHVAPSGQFQPSMIDDLEHDKEFSITRTVMREFGEEFLGIAENESEVTDQFDFYQDRRMAPFAAGLESGAIKLYFLGIGFDPVPTKPGMYIAMVIDAARLPEARRVYQPSWEGRLIELPLRKLEEMSRDERVIPDGATCLQLAFRHLKYLTKP